MSSIQRQSFGQDGKAKGARGFQVLILLDRAQFVELPTRGIHDPSLNFIFIAGQRDKAQPAYDLQKKLVAEKTSSPPPDPRKK